MGISGSRLAVWPTGQTFIGVYDRRKWSVGAVAIGPLVRFASARRGSHARDQSSGAVSTYPALDKAQSSVALGFNGIRRQSFELSLRSLS